MNRKPKELVLLKKMDKLVKDQGDVKKDDSSGSEKVGKQGCGDAYHNNSKTNNIHTIKIDKEKDASKCIDRKKIRERYTIRLKSNQASKSMGRVEKFENDASIGDIKNFEQPKRNAIRDAKISTETSNKLPRTETKSYKPDKEFVTRKPVIKTVTSKKDAKIYKAITFINKKSTTEHVEINIPTDQDTKLSINNAKIIKSISRISVERPINPSPERPVWRKKLERRKKERVKHVNSRETSIVRNKSPPTEVAKWAPNCVSQHTQPYYEAWVDTTLAAITKSNSKNALEKQNIIKSFQRAIEERAKSPEWIYKDFSDVKFTGRIKVRHKY